MKIRSLGGPFHSTASAYPQGRKCDSAAGVMVIRPDDVIGGGGQCQVLNRLRGKVFCDHLVAGYKLKIYLKPNNNLS